MSTRSLTVIAVFALLSGCAVNDQNATRAQGAGAGAAVGAGLGLLVGKDTKSTLVGAAVGGLAGFALGDAVARKKSDYVSTEVMIDKEHQIARLNANEMAKYNVSLRDHLDELTVDIAELETTVDSKRVRQASARDLRARAESDLVQARERLAKVNQEIDVSRELYDQAKAEKSSADLAGWNRQIQELERRRRELALLIGDFERGTRQI